jgi:hypothetical protein
MIDAETLQACVQAIGGRYNGVAIQRTRIVAALRRAGSAGLLSSDLAASCNAPCITKRVSELRRKGHQIDSTLQACTLPDGTVSLLACYVLNDRPSRQLDMFKP